MLTIDSVYRAKRALEGVIRRTDVLYAPTLCSGTELYLKTENLQITGSFKVRGAYYKMTCLSEEEKAKCVFVRLDDMAEDVLLSFAANLAASLSELEIEQHGVPSEGNYKNATINGMAVLVPDLYEIKKLVFEEYLPLENTKVKG